MTIKDLSQTTGLSERAISFLETDRGNAALPTLRLLAEILGVQVAFLGCFESLPEDTLGQRIKKARLYHGYNKKEFANMIGVKVHTLMKWEKGLTKPLKSYKLLLAYLDLLK